MDPVQAITQLNSNTEFKPNGLETIVEELLELLKKRSKKDDDKQLNELVAKYHDHMRKQMAQRFDTLAYFSGNGPVARKLRERLAVNAFLDDCYSVGMDNRLLKAALINFDFKPIVDPATTGRVQKFFENVAFEMFGRKIPLMGKPIPTHEGREISLSTGWHTADFNDGTTLKIFVLRVKLPNKIQACYFVDSQGTSQLMYFHPTENIWLVNTGTVTFEGLEETFKAEWDRFREQKMGQRVETIDVTAEMNELQAMADHLFDNEEKLPNATGGYHRDSEDSSFISIHCNGYTMRFINTRGQYPDRSMMLTRNDGRVGFFTTLKLKDMSEGDRQTLLWHARNVFQQLTQQFIGKVE